MASWVRLGLTLGPSRTRCLSCCILMHHMLPNHSTWPLCPRYRPSLVAPICIDLRCFIICCVSLQTVAEVKKKSKPASQQTTDVVVSGACSSAPSLAEYQALPHLLYISYNFPSFASEWIGSLFLFSRWLVKLPFCTDGLVFSKHAGSGAVTGAVWMGRVPRSRSSAAT